MYSAEGFGICTQVPFLFYFRLRARDQLLLKRISGNLEMEQKYCLKIKTYLVLDQKLNTLNRSSCGLRDGSGDTTHCYRESVPVCL